MGERFFQEFTLRQVLLNAAKNDGLPCAHGARSGRRGLPLPRGTPADPPFHHFNAYTSFPALHAQVSALRDPYVKRVVADQREAAWSFCAISNISSGA